MAATLPGRLFQSLSRRPASGRLVVAFLFWAAFLHPLRLAAAPAIDGLDRYIRNGGYAIQQGDRLLRAANLHTAFIPASTIKVLTGLMALEILGPDYRFATSFFLDPHNNLYVRGEGDPLLTSEAVAEIARQLRDRGISSVRRLILDGSAFAVPGPPPGSENSWNPYDAGSGALAVNFNALPFRVGADGAVSPGEPQTPLLPLMSAAAKLFGQGSYRINVSALPASPDFSNSLRYSGELFGTIFARNNIDIALPCRAGAVPDEARRVLVYESAKTVREMVRLCLYYSSNFIANQLYLSCGARGYGFPATWEKARRMTSRFLASRLPQASAAIHQVDGSGLSLENRITPAAMLQVLNRFSPYVQLLRRQNGIPLKSGTLTGVYAYVGFFPAADGPAPFVLFLNQAGNHRLEILRIMARTFKNLEGTP